MHCFQYDDNFFFFYIRKTGRIGEVHTNALARRYQKNMFGSMNCFVKAHLLTENKSRFCRSAVTSQTWALSTPLLSLLRPKTEVRSQVNIPPSRCLQHASGQTRRDLRVPLISRCLRLSPSPSMELLPQLSAQFRLSQANQRDISARWESHFLKKGKKKRKKKKIAPAHISSLKSELGLLCLAWKLTEKSIYEFPTMPPTGHELIQAVALEIIFVFLRLGETWAAGTFRAHLCKMLLVLYVWRGSNIPDIWSTTCTHWA